MKTAKTIRSLVYFTSILSLFLLNGHFLMAHADIVVTLDRNRGPVDCATSFDPVEQSYLLIRVPDPIASLVLFTGGGGGIFIDDWQLHISSVNFLTRSRHLFASFGFNVVVMDAATDFLSCEHILKGQRLSSAYVSDINAVIQDLRIRYPELPIWVIGTSRGSISAAQTAAALSHESGGPDGLVLTSSNTRSATEPHHLSVFDVDLENITVPTLITAHKKDECWVTPPEDAKAIEDRLVSVPKMHIRKYNKGFEPISGPCKPLSYHGYLGIEPEVVKDIAKWIKKQINKGVE